MSEQVNRSSPDGPTPSTAHDRVLDEAGAMRTTSGDAADVVIRLLWDVAAGLRELEAEMARASGTHPTDLAAISMLSRRHPEAFTIGELGDELGVTKTAATSIVDRLERAGHVRRVRDTRDRRRVHVEVTATAEAVAEQVLSDHLRRIRAALADYTPDEVAVVARFLADLRDALP